VSSHYPSDIAAGMAIGILGAWFFISRLEKWEKKLGKTPNLSTTGQKRRQGGDRTPCW
jgi:membrane-associated phospholipid phosphatase